MTIDCIETGDYCTDTYLIIEGSDAIVIDPGDDYERIVARLNRLGAQARHVLITHAHFDHIGAVARFAKDGTSVYISKVDYDALVQSDFYVDLGFFGETVEPFTADVVVSDGDRLSLCNHDFTVMATPGHTPGGVCYILDDKYIFSGDTLFRLSVGRTDFPFCSHADLMQSVRKLFSLAGDYTVYPGHGDSTNLNFERENNPYVR